MLEGKQPFLNVFLEPEEGVMHRCPCCDYKTLEMRGGFEVCPVCFWEDDGQDSHDADEVRGGPNGSLSLTEARKSFKDFGACEKCYYSSVRRPFPEEA